jgi:hypothetical protein
MRSFGDLYDCGEPFTMSRKIPDGRMVFWKIAYKLELTTNFDGVVPFLIERNDSYHPTDGLFRNNMCEINRFYLAHPLGIEINSKLVELGFEETNVDVGACPQMDLKLKNIGHIVNFSSSEVIVADIF